MAEQVSEEKLQCLLSLCCALVGFGIALTLILLDVNISARVAGLIAAFFSGWGCCHALSSMSGVISTQEPEK